MKYKYVFLTEKDSQVQALAEVVNAEYRGKWLPAYNKAEGIALVPLQGHVLQGLEPAEYSSQYSSFGEDGIFVFPEEYKLKPSTFGNAKTILDRAVEHLREAEKIIIATDSDNEGAAIAMNVIRYAGVEDRVERMLPMGSTHPEELRKAIDNPIDIPYRTMADAGSSRAFIDWSEGMSFSRALSYYLGNKYKTKLNFGGVKTPLIYMVVERDLAFEQHKVSYYWTASGYIVRGKDKIPAKLKRKVISKDKNGKDIISYEEKFESENEIKDALNFLKDQTLKIGEFSRKNSKNSPPKLYELAGLQGDMTRKFSVKPSGTMDIAQKLYDFPVSIQTYPRTDIPYLKSTEYADVKPILTKLKGFIDKDIIDNILKGTIPKRSSTFNDKEVIAHGAIVPTLKGDLNAWLPKLSKYELSLFEFVAKRYVANFMEDYEYISVYGETADINGYIFVFGESVPQKAGWKKIYEDNIENNIKNFISEIPVDLKVGDIVTLDSLKSTKGETKPKPLFTMETLLSAMKNIASLFPDNKEIKEFLGENGIGTNATRADIIDNVLDPKKNGGEPWLIEDKKAIKSTQKARDLIKVMPVEIVSPIKRALLSKKLRALERGELKSKDLINEYREEVKKNIEIIKKVYEERGAIASTISNNISLGACPACGSDIIEKDKLFVCSSASNKKNEATGEWENEGCQYKIFKTALTKFGKSNLTAREVSNMLNKGITQVSLKSQKNGAAYNANIKPDLQWGIKVIFEDKGKK